MRPLHVKPHDVIACSSDTKSSSEAASLYIIECGEVEATHVGLEQQQQQQVVERLSRGDFFGEIELLSVARRLLQAKQHSLSAFPTFIFLQFVLIKISREDCRITVVTNQIWPADFCRKSETARLHLPRRTKAAEDRSRRVLMSRSQVPLVFSSSSVCVCIYI